MPEVVKAANLARDLVDVLSGWVRKQAFAAGRDAGRCRPLAPKPYINPPIEPVPNGFATFDKDGATPPDIGQTRMNAFSRLLTVAAFATVLTACSSAPTVSPSAPDWEHDASWVDARDIPPGAGRGALGIGISPSAPRSAQDASTLRLR